MEAALCLGYGPPPSISLRIPSGTITAPASTRLHFGFNHSSISVSSGFMTTRRRSRHHFWSPGPFALDRSNSSAPSANEKGSGGGKVVRGAVGASLALACALSIIGCGCKMKLKAIAGPKQQIYQKAPSLQQFAPLAPRKVALKSLLDITVSLASKEGRKASPPWSTYSPPSMYEIDQLKKEAVSLMKRRQPDEALYMLKNEHMKYKDEPESAYYMSLVLVEILICQGKYEEALEYMNDIDQKFSELDVRPTLCKAIIYTMLDKDEEAQLWEDFARSVGGFSPYGS